MNYLKAYKFILVMIIILIKALSISDNASAQITPFYFTHINEDNNKNYGRITCITKDNAGYIWFGTYNGLYRYDGYESISFTYSKNDTTSLFDNNVYSLFVDSRGILWIGTSNGLNRYYPETGTFQRIKSYTGKNSKSVPVFSITETKDGRIWCGTWGGGLIQTDPETNNTKYIRLSDLPGLSRKSNNIKQIFLDKNDKIFICTWGDGLLLYDPVDKNITQYVHSSDDPYSIPSNHVLSIAGVSDGEYFVACKDQNISRFSFNDGSFKPLTKVTKILRKKETEVTRIRTNGKGNVCIATYGSGVIIYDLSTGNIRLLKKEKNNIHSLSSNLVTDIFFSQDDNLTWIATTNGINLRDPDIPKFRTFNYLNLPDSITEFNCQGFIIHEKDKICIGTRDEGIWEFYPLTEKFDQTSFQHKPVLNSNDILSLARKNNVVYAGTDKGLNIINVKTRKISQINSTSETNGRLTSNIIKYILTDRSENVWLGTFEGLEVYNEKKRSVHLYKPYPLMNTLSAKNLVRTICKDDNNNLWIGTSAGGLNKFSIDKKQFVQRFTHRINEDVNSISDNRVNDILISKDKKIWIATGRGLNRFDPDKQIFKVLDRNNGLTDENIYSIEEDNNGNIWFSSGRSIGKLDPSTWHFREYNKFDGITAGSFNGSASLKLPSGKLIFGGVNGFNLFHPDSIKENEFSPTIVICDIKILNMSLKEYQELNHRKITGKTVNYIKELKLKHYENSISITFAALNYSLPQKNNYAYILEGFDEKWIFSNTDRTATYTNLPPGEYIFRIKATNNDKIWSLYEKSIKIYIEPPFYKTLLFRILSFLFVIIMMLVYIRIKTNKIKRQKEILEKVVSEKTRELMQANMYLEEKQEEIEVQNSKILSQKEELERHKNDLEKTVKERTRELEEAKTKAEKSEKLKTAFLANISHEIRTPMNAIVGFSTLLNTPGLTGEERDEFTEHIKENSETLLILIDDLLDLSQIESGNMYVQKEKFIVKDIISQMTKLYSRKYSSRKIKLINTFNNAAANTVLFSDPNRVKQVLRNLLENAYKFTEKGTVEIGVEPFTENGKNYILFYVKDSGIGIPADKIDEVFDRFRKLDMNPEKQYSGVGLGLSISRKIIENLGGRIWAESEEGKYAKFIFIVPVEEAE